MCAWRCSSSLACACEWKGSPINALTPRNGRPCPPQNPIPTSPSTEAASRRWRRLEGSRSFSNGLAEAGRGLSKLSRIATLRGAQPPPLSSPIGSDPIFGTDPHFHVGAGDGDRPSAPSPAAAPLCSSNPAPAAATLLKRAAGAGALHLPAASPPARPPGGALGARQLGGSAPHCSRQLVSSSPSPARPLSALRGRARGQRRRARATAQPRKRPGTARSSPSPSPKFSETSSSPEFPTLYSIGYLD